jgi:hypothetical protein
MSLEVVSIHCRGHALQHMYPGLHETPREEDTEQLLRRVPRLDILKVGETTSSLCSPVDLDPPFPPQIVPHLLP